MNVLRIAMWSGPRNLSTAMMRAWENRGDCAVSDEPLYAHYLDATGLDGFWEVVARDGVPLGAILMSAGFFLSAAGRGRQRPNKLVVLLYVGALSVAAGVLTLGVGLLAA